MKEIGSREILTEQVLCVSNRESWDIARRAMLLNGFEGSEDEILKKTLQVGFRLVNTMVDCECLNDSALLVVGNKNRYIIIHTKDIVRDAFRVFKDAKIASEPFKYDPASLAHLDQLISVFSENFSLKIEGKPLDDISLRTLARTFALSAGFHFAHTILAAALKVDQRANVEISFSPENNTYTNDWDGKVTGKYHGFVLRKGQFLPPQSFLNQLKAKLKG